MVDRERFDEDTLNALLAQAARDGPEPSIGLLTRIMADADTVAAETEQAPRAAPKVQVIARWRLVLAAIGGWPALAGLATAAVAGLWLGVAPPSGLQSMTGALTGTTDSFDLGDFMPSFDNLLDEG